MPFKFITFSLLSMLATHAAVAAQCTQPTNALMPTARPTIASIIRDLDTIEQVQIKKPKNNLMMVKHFLMECDLSLHSNANTPQESYKSNLLQIANSYLAYKIYATTSPSSWLVLKQATENLKRHGMSYAKLEQVFSKATLLHCLQYDRPKLKTALKLLTTRTPPKLSAPVSNFDDIMFELALLNSTSNSKGKEPDIALSEFDAAFKKLGANPSVKHNIQYQIALGKYLISIESYEKALEALLNAYWLASEHEMDAQIAIANLALTNLYRSQGALDKALDHASQAANFYQHFESNLGFSETLILLAEIYVQKHKYNFALTHYLNALEIEQIFQRDISQAAINRFIAQTYLKLNRYSHALRYIDTAIDISTRHALDNELTQALVLKGEIAVLMGKPKLAVNTLLRAFHDATLVNKKELLLQGLPALSLGLEKLGHYQHALAVERHYNMLIHSENNKRQAQQAKAFQEKEQIVRSQMQLDELNKQQQQNQTTIIELQKLNLFSFGVLAVLALLLIMRHRQAKNSSNQLVELKKELHSHPRSGLKNLRMLHERLAQSLAQTRANFEQWYLGDMIHEPFKDQLRFAMFEVPYLKMVYLQFGYA